LEHCHQDPRHQGCRLTPVVQPVLPQQEVDVAVFGGGVAGTMAAVSAARAGCSVAIVERYGFFGGNATAGAVAQFNSWQTANGRAVVAGLASEVVDRLRHFGGAGAHEVFVMSTGHRMDRVPYSPELLKLVLDDMIVGCGATPMLHTSLIDVVTVGDRVTQLELLTRGGRRLLRPRVLIDASGDVEALRLAGASFLELEPGEALQPATMMFRFGPIDFDVLDAVGRAELEELAFRGHASGALARRALHHARDPQSQDAWFNIGRLPIDATDPHALSMAEIEGRKQAWRAARFLAAEVPGCAAGRLRAFGTQVGVRETRRVHGDHVLTAQELVSCHRFEDAIAAGAYPIDIHPAQGGGLDFRGLGPDDAYQIPLRSLLPLNLGNALVVGRGISATHEALAAIRVMTISMAVGQAAGLAASLAARAGGAVRRIDVQGLRLMLQGQGALLG